MPRDCDKLLQTRKLLDHNSDTALKSLFLLSKLHFFLSTHTSFCVIFLSNHIWHHHTLWNRDFEKCCWYPSQDTLHFLSFWYKPFYPLLPLAAQKMKKCLMENFVFWAVSVLPWNLSHYQLEQLALLRLKWRKPRF